MKTKKITLLISIMFTFVIFAAVPAFAYEATTPTLWWDILFDDGSGNFVGDLNPDTEVTLAAGETLKANLYISGVAESLIFNAVDGHITYTDADQFDTLTVDETHLSVANWALIRGENVGVTTNGDGFVYQRGGYDLGEHHYGNNIRILGEEDVYYPGSGINFAGIELTANSTIDPYANILLNLYGLEEEEGLVRFQTIGDGVEILHDVINLTINPVPVPAAVWLIGSAMLCMLGINRKKN